MPLQWPKLLVLGDSLTQRAFAPNGNNWMALLADSLQRKCDVLNRGFSGYTSRYHNISNSSLIQNYNKYSCRNLRKHFPDLVTKRSDENVGAILFIGANDANDPDANPLQFVPLKEYVVKFPDIHEYFMIFKCEEIVNIFNHHYFHD